MERNHLENIVVEHNYLQQSHSRGTARLLVSSADWNPQEKVFPCNCTISIEPQYRVLRVLCCNIHACSYFMNLTSSKTIPLCRAFHCCHKIIYQIHHVYQKLKWNIWSTLQELLNGIISQMRTSWTRKTLNPYCNVHSKTQLKKPN